MPGSPTGFIFLGFPHSSQWPLVTISPLFKHWTTISLQLHPFNRFSILSKENPKSLLPSLSSQTRLIHSYAHLSLFDSGAHSCYSSPKTPSLRPSNLGSLHVLNPLSEQPFLWFTICFFISHRSCTQVSHFREDLSWLLLLSRFQLCATPEVAAHQAPPSLGFSRQDHWSGLPFPSPKHESEKWKWSRSVVSDA